MFSQILFYLVEGKEGKKLMILLLVSNLGGYVKDMKLCCVCVYKLFSPIINTYDKTLYEKNELIYKTSRKV